MGLLPRGVGLPGSSRWRRHRQVPAKANTVQTLAQASGHVFNAFNAARPYVSCHPVMSLAGAVPARGRGSGRPEHTVLGDPPANLGFRPGSEPAVPGTPIEKTDAVGRICR